MIEPEHLQLSIRHQCELLGLNRSTFYYRPAGEGPFPVVIDIHGGPESAYHNGWVTSYGNWGQVAAARGYFVFMPNYRASSGRGVEFQKADHKDLAAAEFDDVIDGIDLESLVKKRTSAVMQTYQIERIEKLEEEKAAIAGDIKEVYAEAYVPILQGAPMAENLSMELGYRYSDYSTSGGADTIRGNGGPDILLGGFLGEVRGLGDGRVGVLLEGGLHPDVLLRRHIVRGDEHVLDFLGHLVEVDVALVRDAAHQVFGVPAPLLGQGWGRHRQEADQAGEGRAAPREQGAATSRRRPPGKR